MSELVTLGPLDASTAGGPSNLLLPGQPAMLYDARPVTVGAVRFSHKVGREYLVLDARGVVTWASPADVSALEPLAAEVEERFAREARS